MLVTLVVLSSLAAFVHGVPFHSRVHSLASRQDTISPSDIPAACRTQCIPFFNILNDCASSSVVACGCSASTKRMLDTCFDCLIDLVPSLKPEWDSNEQTFYDGCAAAGKPIPGASTDDLSSTRSSSTTTRTPRSSSTRSSTRSTSTVTATSPLTWTTTVANENNPPSTTAPLGPTSSPSTPFSDTNGAITASLHIWLIIMGALAIGGAFGI